MLTCKRILFAMPLLLIIAFSFINTEATTTPAATAKNQRITNAWMPFLNAKATALKVPYRRTSDKLFPGQVVYQSGYLESPDARFYVTLQMDGNLVLYHMNGTPLWHSATYMHPYINTLEMQHDGNLVMYDGNGRPYWATNTYMYPGSYAEITNCGEFRVVESGIVRWSSNTCNY